MVRPKIRGKESVILLSGKTSSGDEVYVYGESDKIKLITKERREDLPLQGELVGISRISLPLYQAMCDYYQREISYPSGFHYEDCLSDLSAKREVLYHTVEDIVWTEIDDPSHYERAKTFIYPKIYGKELF